MIIGRDTEREQSFLRTQWDTEQLKSWVGLWQKAFNPPMHFGKSNSGRTWRVNGRDLRNADALGDLEVQRHTSLKAYREMEKAFGMLAFIRLGIECKIRDITSRLNKPLIICA